MFVCKECADKTGWTYHLELSHGLCELCDRQRVCDDIHPHNPAKPGSLDAISKERDKRRDAALRAMDIVEKLPIETWAERGKERTRIMISIAGTPAFELMSWSNDMVVTDGRITFPATAIPSNS